MGLDFIDLPEGRVICAAYGLPSTKKLRRGIIKALALSLKNAIIMRNHGALCFGKNYEETFAAAADLERFSENYIKAEYLKKSGRSVYDPRSMRQFALHLEDSQPFPPEIPFESERTAGGFHIHYANGAAVNISFHQSINELSIDEQILREIYLKNTNINYIIHATTPDIAAVSCKDIKLRPLWTTLRK